MRADADRIADMLAALQQLQRYEDGIHEGDDLCDLLQVWKRYHLQLLGEAARALSADFRKSHSQLPWKELIGLRHVLVHDYFEIEQSLIDATLAEDLAGLRQQLADLQKD